MTEPSARAETHASPPAPPLGWLVIPAVAVLAVGATLTLIAPCILERRNKLTPVPPDIARAAQQRAVDLAAQSGISPVPPIIWNPSGTRGTMYVYGRPGRYRIVLSAAMLRAARRHPHTFDVWFGHELAHIRNHDVFIPLFALYSWTALLPVLAVPLVLRMVNRDFAFVAEYLTGVVVLAFTVYLIRAAALRSCEHYAGIRAASWSDRVDQVKDPADVQEPAIARVLQSAQPPRSPRAGTRLQDGSPCIRHRQLD